MDRKPGTDPVSGCTHIINMEHPAFGYRRGCAECGAIQPRDIQEERLAYCWYCGGRFDHTDNEPKEDDDAYD